MGEAHRWGGFPLTAPARFNSVIDCLGGWAEEDPDAIALISIDSQGKRAGEATVADLLAEVESVARGLTELGLAKGDRILVMLPRGEDWYTAVLGAMRVGIVPLPTPNLLTTHDLAYRLRASGARVVITDPAGAEKIDAIDDDKATLDHRIIAGGGRQGWLGYGELKRDGATARPELPTDPTAADEDLLIYFTSGTVSEPKMVLHRQEYGLGHVATARFWHDLRAGDRHWTVSDTGWAKAAWGGLFGQWYQRATVVQVDLASPSAEAILGAIADHDITSFCAPPTLYRTLVQAHLDDWDLPTLRHCTSAGEPLNPGVIERWREGTGLTIHDGYGQTETTALVANVPGSEIRPGSMGKPLPGWEVDVLDENGAAAPDGVIGDVAVRCEPRPVGLFSEYVDAAEATAERFRGGRYLTGDRAARDPDGYFWFEGREDDVITSSAYRIGPFEVESALVAHDVVVEAAVVGKPDPDRTEIVTAFVVLVEGHEGDEALIVELQEHCKQRTAPYKYPREIFFVDELPKTVSGKIRRSELRESLRVGQ